MNGPDLLQQNVGCVRTRMGAFFPGERVVFRGHDLHRELNDLDWIELYAFGITGRRFSPPQVRLLHALWVYTSYPEPRVWNNRVAALAGTARSTGSLGIAGALAVSEAHIYGGGVFIQAASFLIDARKRLDAGESLADCVQAEMKAYRRIAGYGRPLINADERIAPIMELARSLDLDSGPHLRLAFAVEQFLLDSGRDLRMNYGAVLAAFGADLGMSPQELYLVTIPLFLAGMPPCFIEASQRPEGTLLPLSCAGILYEGPAKRRWRRDPEAENCSLDNICQATK